MFECIEGNDQLSGFWYSAYMGAFLGITQKESGYIVLQIG